MRAKSRQLSNNGGFTLIELLIAMVMAGLVGMAAYTVFQGSNHSYVVQENVSETQQNVRVAMDRLATDLRMAGFGLPDPPFSLSIGGVTHTAPVAITNSSSGPDTITLIGLGYEAGKLSRGSATDCNVPGSEKLCLDDVTRFTSSLADRKFVSLNGIKYLEIASVDAANDKLNLNAPLTLDQDYPDDTPLFIIQAVRYTIETDGSPAGCTTTKPCLASEDFTGLRGNGAQLLAEDVEDIQFAYTLTGSPTFVNNASSSSAEIAAVRLNVVGKTRTPDLLEAGTHSRPAVEDHAAGSNDGFLRRVMTSVIKVRNPRNGT